MSPEPRYIPAFATAEDRDWIEAQYGGCGPVVSRHFAGCKDWEIFEEAWKNTTVETLWCTCGARHNRRNEA